MAEANAKAESSCKRCHRRKKRCDRSLPECRACHHAGASCSFLDDKTQVASYPIAYVQKLERRVKELESQFSAPSSSRTSQNDPLGCYWGQDPEVLLDNILIPDNLGQSPQMQWLENPVNTVPISPPDLTTQKADNLAEELRVLSLQAAAERYLGSSSGISFAKLTQTVLQRLSPDPDGFVFDRNLDNISQTDPNPNLLSSYSPVFADMYTSFASPLTFSPTFDPPIEDYELTDLSLLEASHISYILDFYFAHSHTLYPFIRKDEFIAVLWRIYADPLDPLAQSPLWQLRIWMVLAIGSTTYCSVSLTDESEPTRLYNKAMTYFEAAMRCGDLAGLEVLMLQVSYSFFNKIGPNTWFLVGVAARMATGMGLHTSEIYQSLAMDIAEQRKRLFFSLYMMDRVVSLALGRPFAIQDEDITVEPFADADDESIKADSIKSSSPLQPSTMVIPLHILSLRRLAGQIARQVHHCTHSQTPNQTPESRASIIHSLHQDLLQWRRNMPFPLPDLQSKVPHLCSSWFDLNYYTHIVMLYRPSPLLPSPGGQELKTLSEAAGMAIRQAVNLHRQQRFAFNWLNLVTVFHSSLSLLYTTASVSGGSGSGEREGLGLVLDLDLGKAMGDLGLAVELLEAFCRKFSSAEKILGMVKAAMERLRVYTTTSTMSMG